MTAINSTYLDLTTLPYLYYSDPVNFTTGVCVSQCPNTTALSTSVATSVCGYTPQYYLTHLTFVQLVGLHLCAPFTYASKPILNRCVPTDAIPLNYTANSVTPADNSTTYNFGEIFSLGRTYGMMAITDLVSSVNTLIAFAGITVAICLIWTVLLQLVAGILVWGGILAGNALFIAGTIWVGLYWNTTSHAYTNSSIPQVQNTYITYVVSTYFANYESQAALALFVVMIILTTILLLITLAMLKRIPIAVEVIKEAGQAVMRMPFIAAYPLVFFVAIILLVVYFIAIMLFMFSPGKTVTIAMIGLTTSDPYVINAMIWYHLIGFIWTFAFFSGVHQITIAGAIGHWYWTRDKSMPITFPVMRSLYRTLRYHLGSVALGSLLLTLVEIIRIILWRITQLAKKTQNKFLQYILCCFQCCATCVEGLMKFINKNAYIYIAINGDTFFSSASEATGLLIRNALRMVAVDFVADFVLVISKLAVTAAATFGCYWYITNNPQNYANLSFPFITVAFVGGIAFMISTAFFSIYHLAVDTIFLSFLEDCEKNDGSFERPYYMSETLKKIIGDPHLVEKPNKGQQAVSQF